MKTLFTLITLVFCLTTYAQKIKIDDNIVYVDGEAWIKYEKKNMATEASVMSLKSESEEIYIMFLNYSDPNEVTKANPEGKVRWVEINFLTLGVKCEISNLTHKAIAELLYENKIYVDGSLSSENTQKLVQKYGTRFSDNRPKNGNVQIIINN